jgi:hypothetical protein
MRLITGSIRSECQGWSHPENGYILNRHDQSSATLAVSNYENDGGVHPSAVRHLHGVAARPCCALTLAELPCT